MSADTSSPKTWLPLLLCLCASCVSAAGPSRSIGDPLLAYPPDLVAGKLLPGDDEVPPCRPGPAVAPKVLSLADAVDLALCHQPQVQAAWANVKIQAGQVGEARAASLPTINAGATRQSSASSSELGSSERNVNTLYATLTWRLLDFGGRSANQRAADALLQAASASRDATVQKTMSSVVGQYYEAMSARASHQAREKGEALSRQMLEIALRREQRGAGSLQETLQARTYVAKAEMERTRAAGQYKKSLVALAVSVGLQGEAEDAPQFALTTEPDQDPIGLEHSLPAWLRAGKQYHPSILAAQAQLEAAREKLKATRAEGMPTLDLNASQYVNGMAGGKGDDSYYVDNADDKVIEQAGEGVDTVYAKVSTTLSANVENLVLLDSGKPQSALVNGVDVLVYGYPGSYQLNYNQGNAVPGYEGTCGETSVANVTMLGDRPVSEKEVVQRAIEKGLCDTVSDSPGSRGGSSSRDQKQLLKEFGFASKVSSGFDAQAVARDIKAGKGVTINVYADALWDGTAVPDDASTDHRVTVTGVACSAATGDITGFYIADSGRGRASDMCRFVTAEQMRTVTSVKGANTLTTDAPIKMLQQNINAVGNELGNILVGNRGDNMLTGGLGNDLLIGGAGDDTYLFAKGDGQDVIFDHDATKGNIDTVQFSDASQTDLRFKHVGNDLQIKVLGTADQVTVKDWYVGGTSGADNHIERIKTADGKTLYDTDVERLIQAMASFAPPAATQTALTSGQREKPATLLSVTH